MLLRITFLVGSKAASTITEFVQSLSAYTINLSLENAPSKDDLC